MSWTIFDNKTERFSVYVGSIPIQALSLRYMVRLVTFAYDEALQFTLACFMEMFARRDP